MNHQPARWRLSTFLRMAFTTQLCLSLLLVTSPVAHARRVIAPMIPMMGDNGSLYKINRDGGLIYGSDQMKLAELKQDEKGRLYHLAHSSEDENLKKIASELAQAENEMRRNEGGCSTISGWFGCDEQEKAKKAEDAKKLADLKLNELNQATKAFYGEHKDYVKDLAQFPTYQFMGINDTFSRGDAEEEAKLPPYCQNYPSVGTESYKDYMGESHNEDVLYSTCIDQTTPFVVTVGNLVDNYLEVERFNYKKGQELLERELANESIKKILKTRSDYTAINPGSKDSEDDVLLGKLNSCLSDNAATEPAQKSAKETQAVLSEAIAKENEQASSGQNLKREYATNNVKNAVISAALFQIRDENKAWSEDEKAKLFDEFSKKCVEDMSAYSKPKEDPTYQFCIKYKDSEKEIDKQAAIQESKSMGPIALLYKSDPTLFTAVNDSSFFDWFNYQPAQSDLAKKMTSLGKSGELVSGVKEAIAKDPDNPLKAAETFLAANKDSFTSVVDLATNDASIQSLSNEKTKEHIRGLTDSALKLCEGDIEHLHHFPELYDKVMNNVASSGDPNAQEKIMQMQGAYCYMLRKDPPNQETGFTLMQGLGIGLAVLGTAAQFVPALGTVVGTGMILAGGALTMADAGIKLDRRMGELATQNAMLAAGWSDYKSKLDAQSKAWDAGSDMVIETAFFALDISTAKGIAAVVKGSEAGENAAHLADGASDLRRAAGSVEVKPPVQPSKALAVVESVEVKPPVHTSTALTVVEDAKPLTEVKPGTALAVIEDAKPVAAVKPSTALAVVEDAKPLTEVKPGTALAVIEDAKPAVAVKPSTALAVVEDAKPAAAVKPSTALAVVEDAKPAVVVKPSTALTVVEDAKPAVAVKPSTALTVVEDAKPAVAVKPSTALTVVEDAKPAVAVKPSTALTVVEDAKPAATVKSVDNSLVLKAESVTPEVIKPVDQTRRLGSVSETRPALAKPVESVEILKPIDSVVDDSADTLAKLRSEVMRRPATSGKIELAASLSKNADGLTDDFIKALSDIPNASRQRLLEHIDKGHFAPEELSKIMDDAVASFRRACQ